MKVVYEEGIIERIDKSITAARDANKQIENIILNAREWRELQDVMGNDRVDVYATCFGGMTVRYQGITILEEE